MFNVIILQCTAFFILNRQAFYINQIYLNSSLYFKISGIGRLTDILNNKSASETVRCEAAGVIAQITSPTLDHCQHLAGFIENMDDLISALTGISITTSLIHKFKNLIYSRSKNRGIFKLFHYLKNICDAWWRCPSCFIFPSK